MRRVAVPESVQEQGGELGAVLAGAQALQGGGHGRHHGGVGIRYHQAGGDKLVEEALAVLLQLQQRPRPRCLAASRVDPAGRRGVVVQGGDRGPKA